MTKEEQKRLAEVIFGHPFVLELAEHEVELLLNLLKREKEALLLAGVKKHFIGYDDVSKLEDKLKAIRGG